MKLTDKQNAIVALTAFVGTAVPFMVSRDNTWWVGMVAAGAILSVTLVFRYQARKGDHRSDNRPPSSTAIQ